MSAEQLLKLIDATLLYIEQYQSNTPCVCGGLLALMPCVDIYDGNMDVTCDFCYRINLKDDQFWHCLNGNEFHRRGFDVCSVCIDDHHLYKDLISLSISSNNCRDNNLKQICISSNVSKCCHLSRLTRALRNEDDDALYLLNDFLHLMNEHDKDFSFIRRNLGECDSKCDIFYRFNRARHENEKPNVLLHHNDTFHAIRDKIHCYYLHDHECKDRRNSSRILKYNQLIENISPQYKSFKEGASFYYGYWDETETWRSMTVSPKWGSMKEELTRNSFCRLSMSQFDNEYKKATLYYDTDYRRNAHTFMIVLIPAEFSVKHMTLSIQHILALMIYCNYTHLQYKFSKTYRENKGKDHNQFYFLGMYLKLSVQKFGTRIKDGNIDTFYHGCSEALIFRQKHVTLFSGDFGLALYCPLSTTSSLSVATTFTSNNNGLIVKFRGNRTGDNKYFSVSWLSDFPYEKEYVFLQDQWHFMIDNIIDVRVGYEYKNTLKALEILMNLTSDNYMKFAARNKTKHVDIFDNYMKSIRNNGTLYEDAFILDKSSQLLLVKLLEIQLFNSNFTEYGRELISAHLTKQTHVFFDLIKMQHEDSALHVLYDKKYDWVKWNFVKRLFPRMQQISVIIHNQDCNLVRSTLESMMHDLTAKNSTLSLIHLMTVNDDVTNSLWNTVNALIDELDTGMDVMKTKYIHNGYANCHCLAIWG